MAHPEAEHSPVDGQEVPPQVHVTDEREDPTPSVDIDALGELAAFVADDQGVPPAMEIGVLCVDEGPMAELNATHMGATGATDVLAFPIDRPDEIQGDVPAVLGDIVVCPAVAARQAQGAGHAVAAELQLLVVHGVLHLLGHDHAEEAPRREMFALTERLLADWRGATRP